MQKGIIEFRIRGFRGIASLDAEPDGRSFDLRGRNGAGKSSGTDALYWGLGGSVEGEVVGNQAERAEADIRIGDYVVRRQQAKGGKPTLTVKPADGKGRGLDGPAGRLAGFLGAIQRRTFTMMPAAEQFEAIRKLAPGLDVADLDDEAKRVYAERTDVNRDAKALRVRAEAVKIPEGPADAGEEKSLAELAARHAAAVGQKAKNDGERAKLDTLRRDHQRAVDATDKAAREVADLEAKLAAAREAHAAAVQKADEMVTAGKAQRAIVDALADPDLTAITDEMATVEAHNASVRDAREAAGKVELARAQRAELEREATALEAESEAMTARLDAIAAERAARIAGAACPVKGLALADGVVTFDDGKHGPVEARVGILNDAACILLDVEVAAALGYRIVAIRNAERLDPDHRAKVRRFAAERGVQLICEVRTDEGESVEAVTIEDADEPAEPAPPVAPESTAQLPLGDTTGSPF